LKLAPLATLVIAGLAIEPDPDAVTLTVTDALLVLLYVAVIVPGPNGNCKPFTASVAVAVPADPVNTTDSKGVPPIEKEIDPDGVVPFVEVTIAIKYTTSLAATVLKLLSSVTLAAEPGVVVLPPFHPITSLYASTDPSPVA
jgi:hypothetical protein